MWSVIHSKLQGATGVIEGFVYEGLLGIFLDVDTLHDPSKNISFPQCYQEMVHRECFLNCSKTKDRQHELALLPGKIKKKSVGTGWKKLFTAQIADPA